ncbi:MAG: hypothetical protein ABW063_14535, partial [Caulobacter sp.]
MTLTRRSLVATGAASLAPLDARAAQDRPPPGYPRSYRSLMEAAARERRVIVYGNIDRASLAGVLAA